VTERVLFRFDASRHEYLDLATRRPFPHITGMLEAAGLVDDLWYTEESSARGTAVHRMTADYDLGALDVETCVSPFRGYLLAHVEAMGILRPEILTVEEPRVHRVHRYGGRPDRTIRYDGAVGVLEIKTTTAPAKSHPVQTALQAILVEEELGVPAESLVRLALYLGPTGRWRCIQHGTVTFDQRRDFDRARAIIRDCCRGGL
jgi:hypothetical protein